MFGYNIQTRINADQSVFNKEVINNSQIVLDRMNLMTKSLALADKRIDTLIDRVESLERRIYDLPSNVVIDHPQPERPDDG